MAGRSGSVAGRHGGVPGRSCVWSGASAIAERSKSPTPARWVLRGEACWFAQRSDCMGPLTRAHLIPRQTLRREFPRGAVRLPNGPWEPAGREGLQAAWEALTAQYGRAEKRQLKYLLWDERLFVPACLGHHGALDFGGPGKIVLERSELPESVEEFARDHGLGWYLDRTYGARD